MNVVMVRCPYRGRAVSTGIEIDPEAFAQLPDTLILTKCELCGLDHVWWKTEAWLEPSHFDSKK